MEFPFARLDAATRRWWRLVGRRVDLGGEHAWLDGPMTTGPRVRDGWLETAAMRLGGSLAPRTPTDGLLPDLGVLDGPGFRARDVHPEIADFYAHTSGWRMEAWSEWSPLFAPSGGLITRLFGRRVGQLALPVSPLDVSRGIDSTVQVFRDDNGRHLGAAWLRRLRHSDTWVFSGLYRAGLLPGDPQPRIHVAFPLEEGNIQVFLRPGAGPAGRLMLTSGPGPMGADGAYVVARSGEVTAAAKLPLHERFELYVDDEGVLRTDHELRLGRVRALRLHYRLDRRRPA